MPLLITGRMLDPLTLGAANNGLIIAVRIMFFLSST